MLSFGDLRARFAAVVACSALRDGHAKLSPEHEYRLLKIRFPMLQVLALSSSPRKIYEAQRWLERPLRRARTPPAMTAYTFVLQLELVPNDAYAGESLCVTTGRLEDSCLVFEIEDGAWERADEKGDDQHYDVRATGMATRRSGGILECARLFCSFSEGHNHDCYVFEVDDIPYQPDTAFTFAMRKLKQEQGVSFDPDTGITWTRLSTPGPSVLRAQLRHFTNASEWTDMDADELPVFLDQFLEWRRS